MYKYKLIKENKDTVAPNHKTVKYICTCYGFVLGMEYSSIIVSLPFYLENDVKTEKPKLFYSIIATAMACSAAVSGVLFGKFMDRTRNLRLTLLLFPFIGVIGNLMYTVHTSVWFLVIGRILCGMGEAAQPAITGEFSRLYTGEDLTDALTMYQALYSVGFVIGPATTALFFAVNFKVGRWVINENNFIGVFYAVILPMFMLVVYNFVPSTTKKMDENEGNADNDINQTEKSLKEDYNPLSLKDIANQSEDTQDNSNTYEENKKGSLTLFDILRDFDVMILIISSALLKGTDSMAILCTNLVASSYYHWSLTLLAILTAGCITVYIIVMIPCGSRIIGGGGKRLFILYIVASILCAINLGLITLARDLQPSKSVQIILITIIILFLIFFGMSMVILARKLLFQMVPKHSASFAEGVRNMAVNIVCIIGYFSATFVLPIANIAMSAILALLLLITGIMIFRSEKYIKERY